MREARDDDALVGLDAIREAEREIVDACTAGVPRAGNVLILERVAAMRSRVART